MYVVKQQLSCLCVLLFSGLLLPRVGVEHHGIERTDFGKLGGGIYFSDSLRLVENLNLTSLLVCLTHICCAKVLSLIH